MLLTRKASTAAAPAGRLSRNVAGYLGNTIDRRAFLKRSGLAVGAGAAVSQLPFSMMGKAKAAGKVEGGNIESETHGLHTLLGRLLG